MIQHPSLGICIGGPPSWHTHLEIPMPGWKCRLDSGLSYYSLSHGPERAEGVGEESFLGKTEEHFCDFLLLIFLCDTVDS